MHITFADGHPAIEFRDLKRADIFEDCPFVRYESDSMTASAPSNSLPAAVTLMSYHAALEEPHIETYDEFLSWLRFCAAHSMNVVNVFKHRCYYAIWWFDLWGFRRELIWPQFSIHVASHDVYKKGCLNTDRKYIDYEDLELDPLLQTNQKWWSAFMEHIRNSMRHYHNRIRSAGMNLNILQGYRSTTWLYELEREIRTVYRWIHEGGELNHSPIYQYGDLDALVIPQNLNIAYPHGESDDIWEYGIINKCYAKLKPLLESGKYMGRDKVGQKIQSTLESVWHILTATDLRIAIVGTVLWNVLAPDWSRTKNVWKLPGPVHLVILGAASDDACQKLETALTGDHGANLTFRFSYADTFETWAQLQNLGCMRAWYEVGAATDIICFPSFHRAILTSRNGPLIRHTTADLLDPSMHEAMNFGFSAILLSGEKSQLGFEVHIVS